MAAPGSPMAMGPMGVMGGSPGARPGGAPPPPPPPARFDQVFPANILAPIDLKSLLQSSAEFTSSHFLCLPPKEITELASLPARPEDEIWHITVRKLTCWVIPEQGGYHITPVRPKALFITRIYPENMRCVLACVPLNSPIVDPPSSTLILEQLLKIIRNPRKLNMISIRISQGPQPQPGQQPPPGQTIEPVQGSLNPGRPAKICFDDASHVYTLGDTLKAIGIAPLFLRIKMPLTPWVDEFSKQLIQRKVTHMTGSSMAPGMTTSPGIIPVHIRAFMKVAREFASACPWEHIPDFQTFRIRMDSPSSSSSTTSSSTTQQQQLGSAAAKEPLVAWARVLGNQAFFDRANALKRGNHPNSVPYPRSIVVSFKRFDVEMKAMQGKPTPTPLQLRGPQGQIMTAMVPVLPPTPPAVPNPVDLVCAACSTRASPEITASMLANPPSSASSTTSSSSSSTTTASSSSSSAAMNNHYIRCAACQEVYYCSAKCQSQHATTHSSYCNTHRIGPFLDKPTPGGPPVFGYLAPREISVGFVLDFEMPFADLNEMDKLGLQPGLRDEYPFAILRETGSMKRPNVGELTWLIRAMKAVLAFWRARPDLVNDLIPMEFEQEVELLSPYEKSYKEQSAIVKKVMKDPAARRAAIEATVKSAKAGGGGGGASSASSSSEESTSSSKTELTSADVIDANYEVEKRWDDLFIEPTTTAFVRVDPILNFEGAKILRKEVSKFMGLREDPAGYHPGVFVPTRAVVPSSSNPWVPPAALLASALAELEAENAQDGDDSNSNSKTSSSSNNKGSNAAAGAGAGPDDDEEEEDMKKKKDATAPKNKDV